MADKKPKKKSDQKSNKKNDGKIKNSQVKKDKIKIKNLNKIKKISITKSFENVIFQNQNALTKLRIAIVTIFLLSTISMFMAVINFTVTIFLILISYFLLFYLMIKILTIKKL